MGTANSRVLGSEFSGTKIYEGECWQNIKHPSTLAAMVNTFLPYANLESVKYLDNKRLNKQISEAQQILRVLWSLHAIARCFNYGYTEGTLANYITTLKRMYESYKGVYKIYHNDLGWCLTSLFPVYMSGWYEVKLGFCHHPAVRLWYGYESSLTYYINCCIDEFRRRGGNHNFELRPYYVYVTNTLPHWLTEEFSQRHRGSLCSKMPEYYVPLFGNEPFYGYLWPV